MKTFVIAIVCLLTLGCHGSDPGPTPQVAVTGAPIDSGPVTPAATGLGTRVAPTDPAERARLAQDAPRPPSKDGYTSVSFNELSGFDYHTDKTGKLLPSARLPDEIAGLDGAPVAVSGFLVPIEFQEDKVSSLILVRNQLLCCYGEEPRLNEWVFVNVDPPVEMITDVPVTLFGTFYASPDEEEGQVISLYRMEATGMERMDT